MSTVAQGRKGRLRDWSILLPAETGTEAERILPLALSLLDGNRQSLRNELGRLAIENAQVRHLTGSLVSHRPWQEVAALIEERMKDDDLLLLGRRCSTASA